jgi:microcystin-dependent protein
MKVECFLGEIRLFPYNRIPDGWEPCNGQELPIGENQALYSLIGDRYGNKGDRRIFSLPNLNGRVVVGTGNNYPLADTGGSETVTLDITNTPNHYHTVCAGETYQVSSPKANFLGNGSMPAKAGQTNQNLGPVKTYISKTRNLTPLHSATVSTVGGASPHENRMPFMALVYCIAVRGIFPMRQ